MMKYYDANGAEIAEGDRVRYAGGTLDDEGVVTHLIETDLDQHPAVAVKWDDGEEDNYYNENVGPDVNFRCELEVVRERREWGVSVNVAIHMMADTPEEAEARARKALAIAFAVEDVTGGEVADEGVTIQPL